MCPCFPIAIELPTLQALEERARSTGADRDRQAARLKSLIADFDRERLTASPQSYSLMRGEVEQQELIVANAEQASAVAERELTSARADYDRQHSEDRRQARRKVLHAALDELGIELSRLQAEYGRIPELITLARQKHSAVLAELAAL